MANNPKIQPDAQSNQIKDPEDWVTGDEPMTGAQASYLKILSEEAGDQFDDQLTKADASKRIEELQEKTAAGRSSRGRWDDADDVFGHVCGVGLPLGYRCTELCSG